tara:strand:+ start:7204 stop:7572 length:369 start_codon:yes stop_codon:yes gene_type:complete
MDINGKISRNNPLWDSNTVLNSIYLTTTGAAVTAVQQVAVQGLYCIISNTGPVTLYVGNDADGAQVPVFDPSNAATFVGVGGRGVALEPNATLEMAFVADALLYVRNISATSSAYCSVLWFN